MGALPQPVLAAVLVAAGLAAIVAAFWLGRDAAIARRVFVRFLLNIALPLTVILGAMVGGLALAFDFETGVWQAIIAALVIAAGWLTTAIFAEVARVQDKAERLRDFHKAIYAEIGNTLQILWGNGESERDGALILERMRADEDFVPFIPREMHDMIFSTLITDIDVLPRQTIDPIVAYYSQIRSVAALAEDMRGTAFQTLAQDRRIAIYSDYLDIRITAFASGQHVLALIGAYAEGGAKAAVALQRQVEGQ